MNHENQNKITEYWKVKIKKENPHTWNKSIASRNSCIDQYIKDMEEDNHDERNHDFREKSFFAFEELKKEIANEADF